MASNQVNGVTIITGTGNTPQTIINAGHGVLSGNKTIALSTHIKIDGGYNDTGWHYELATGKRVLKGSNCDWVSGMEIYGFIVDGATWSIDSFGSSWSFNEGDGGKIYWRKVVMTARTGGRCDLSFGGTLTEFDVDGFIYDTKYGGSDNTNTIFDVGIMKNITFIRTNHGVGGNGIIENLRHSGLLEGGTENKVFAKRDNYHFVKYKPYISAPRKRLATGFHTFSPDDASGRKIYFDELDTPDWWDNTLDIVAYGGSGKVICTRRINSQLKDVNGVLLQGVRVAAQNVEDDTFSLYDYFDNEVNELVETYIGHKTGGSKSYTIPDARKDYQDKIILAYKYGKNLFKTSVVDMRVNNFTDGIFLTDDTDITEIDKTMVAAYPFTVALDATTLTLTGIGEEVQIVTAQQVYDAIALYMEINLVAKDIRWKRVGDSLNGVLNDVDVVLDNIEFIGSLVLNSTKTLTLLNESSISDYYIDSTRDSLLKEVNGAKLRVVNPNDDSIIFEGYDYVFRLNDLTVNPVKVYVLTGLTWSEVVEPVQLVLGINSIDLGVNGLLLEMLDKIEAVPKEVWSHDKRTLNDALFE